MQQKTYTTEELQVYTSIVLRYYNYYMQSVFTDNYQNDKTIQEFSDWYNKFIFDADMRTIVKQHNQITTDNDGNEPI